MNWASSDFGAEVVSVSSEVVGCEASHVLVDDDSLIWLSEPGVLPQWLCISMVNIPRAASLEIRTIGWHCWHSYTTNPREIRLHVSKDGAKFRVWDTFSANGQQAGSQLFCCAPISVSLYPYLALEILTTFGGNQTYLNRISFFSEELSPSSIGSADGEYNMKSTLDISPMMQLLGFDDDDEDSKSDDQRHSPAAANLQANLNLDISQLTGTNHKHDNPRAGENGLVDRDSKINDSNDAFSVVQSLTEDTTHLVEQLQKALGLDDSIVDPASSLQSIKSSVHSPSRPSPANSRRNSDYKHLSPGRIHRPSSASEVSQQYRHNKKDEVTPGGLTTTNEKSSTTGAFSRYSKVESLLTDSNLLATSRLVHHNSQHHDGHNSSNTGTMSSSVDLNGHNHVSTSMMSTGTEVDLRLRELEHKFQTIVDLLQQNNGPNNIQVGHSLHRYQHGEHPVPPMPLIPPVIPQPTAAQTTADKTVTHPPLSPRSIGDSSSSKFHLPPPQPPQHQQQQYEREKPFLLSDIFLSGREERREPQTEHQHHRSSVEVIRESIRESLETIGDAGEDSGHDRVQSWVDQILSEVRQHRRLNPLSSSDFHPRDQRDELADSVLRDEYGHSHEQSPRRHGTPSAHFSSQQNSRNEDETGDEELDRLVQELHQCVLQKTIKEAQLKLLNPAYRSKPASPI